MRRNPNILVAEASLTHFLKQTLRNNRAPSICSVSLEHEEEGLIVWEFETALGMGYAVWTSNSPYGNRPTALFDVETLDDALEYGRDELSK